MTDLVAAAERSVSYTAFTVEPDGRPLPQVSARAIIADMLRLLDVRPGLRVLEVGTGSGYSTALLAALTGPQGKVTSLDIDPHLVDRAERLLRRHALDRVHVAVADGRHGYPPAAPFDRLVAWATAECLPTAWLDQVRTGGVIVAPLRLLPLAGLAAVVALLSNGPGRVPIGDRVMPGGFVPLEAVPRHAWLGPAEDADVVEMAGDEPTAWLSAEWMRAGTTEPRRILDLVRRAPSRRGLLADGEDAQAFRAYLLAARPPGLTTAFTEEIGHAIGCSAWGSVALVSLCDGRDVAAGTPRAEATLRRSISAWRAIGRPGFRDLRLDFEPTAGGWSGRVEV